MATTDDAARGAVLTDDQKARLKQLGDLVQSFPKDHGARLALILVAPRSDMPGDVRAAHLAAIGSCCPPCCDMTIHLMSEALTGGPDVSEAELEQFVHHLFGGSSH